jgi:hypothetical protein
MKKNHSISSTYINSRLQFIPSQDPNLYIGLGQLGYTLGHTVLELILDGSRSHKHQILLDLIIAIAHSLRTVLHGRAGHVILARPLSVLLVANLLPRQAQRSQRVLGKLVQVVLALLEQLQARLGQALLDDRVGALAKEHDLSVDAADHRHALADVVEVEHVQHVEGSLVAAHRARDGLRRAGLEDEAEVARGRDERALVRRLRLVDQARVGLLLGHDCVTHAEEEEEAGAVFVAALQRLYEASVVEFEARLVVRVRREVQRRTFRCYVLVGV